MRGFSGVISGISSIRVCDEVCFCVWLDVVGCDLLSDTFRKTQTTQTRQRVAQPEQVCAPDSSLRLSSVALAPVGRELLLQPLWRCCEDYSLNLFLSKCFQLATPKRLRQQLASETSESDALPCLCGLRFFPNKDRSKSLQPRLRKFQKSS